MLQDPNQTKTADKSLLCASERLMRAAFSGLVAVSVTGCGDDSDSTSDKANGQKLTQKELKAVCSDMVDEAAKSVDLEAACADKVTAAQNDANATCKSKVSDAKTAAEGDANTMCVSKVNDAKTAAQADATTMCMSQMAEAEKACTGQVTDLKTKCAPILLSSEEKTGNSEQKEYTFAALTKKCDDAGGYIEIHAGCGLENDCRGFSFGDWGPDGATLTEHSCSGVNGCNGLSCVVLPKDKGLTGKQILEQKDPFGISGPGPCNYCHATDWDSKAGTFDATKFRVHQFPEGTRTTANWLDRSAAEQERIVAFGSHGVRSDGVGYRIMSGYKDVLSRAEIARAVAYIRTLPPVMTAKEITKIKD